jgi:hypothetical protein
MIPESHYPDASLLQDLATALVMSARVRFIVLPAIQFDGKLDLVAVKVQNIGRKGMLSPEFESPESSAT